MDLWRDLGLAGKRAIIVHQDDLGYTEAQNRAYLSLGLPTGSVMMPAQWAPQIRQGDLGVHLTLTSEWEHPRLRPLTGGASLRDPAGYFWPTLEAAWQHMAADEARLEMRAQIEAALQMGLDITHIDTHMGTVMRPDLAQAYTQLALEYRLPAFLPADLSHTNLPDFFRAALEELLSQVSLPKFGVVDGYFVPHTERTAWYVDTLSELGPGVYHLIHHAAVPTPEGQALPDWEGRRADLEALQDPAVRRVLSEFTLLTYRDVRDGLRRYV